MSSRKMSIETINVAERREQVRMTFYQHTVDKSMRPGLDLFGDGLLLVDGPLPGLFSDLD